MICKENSGGSPVFVELYFKQTHFLYSTKSNVFLQLTNWIAIDYESISYY